MARDWSKLGTETWVSKEGIVYQEGVAGGEVLNCVGDLWATAGEILLADFIALARNAFDVMMRRGWNPCLSTTNRWIVETPKGNFAYRSKDYGGDGSRIAENDPFTALVEADRWYKENVEKATPVQ